MRDDDKTNGGLDEIQRQLPQNVSFYYFSWF